MVSGAHNRVELRVAAISDFLVMKCFALAGREKPKDAYDICYCLEHAPGGMESIAAAWQTETQSAGVAKALPILREKFARLDGFGPQLVVAFHHSADSEARDREARTAFELVQRFLGLFLSEAAQRMKAESFELETD